MNKKFFKYYFIFIFVFALMVLSGGCGGSSSSGGGTTGGANSALRGAWMLSGSNSGTAEITAVNEDDDELEKISEAWGEIPSDVSQAYQNAKKTSEIINANVSRVMAIFEDCDIDKTSGTAKLTALIVLSDSNDYLPILFNGVTLSTTRVSSDTWTATTPDGGTLSINMADEKINLSGTLNYLGYDCKFNTVIEKDTPNSLNPQTVLNGTWNLDTTQAGGYVYDNSKIISAVVPSAASIYFNVGSDLKTSTASFYSAAMTSSTSSSDNSTALLEGIYSTTDNTLTQVNGNVYKFTSTNGNGLIFIENTDEIYMFSTEIGENNRQASMFLPLKKVSIDPVTAMNKTWTASDGGGYLNLGDVSNPENDPEIEFIKSLNTVSFILQDGTLSFSDVTINNDGSVTATADINASFLISNKVIDAIFKLLGMENKPISMGDTLTQVKMTRSGNFLKFTDDEDGIYNLSFISDTEAFLSITSSSNYGAFGLKFKVK